ncbi:hypothetical protein ST47_g8217 [Ascochyta rabiei]|uniref:Uncharacterized protein n=1 Tax=Didymella rabiei TaxID=5454 RepID=A0A162ZHT1_DIDRA|nr:hypothetical protein ST47_g8217 [Ascochyta rabiei]
MFIHVFGPACVGPDVAQRLTSRLRSTCSSRQTQDMGTCGKASVVCTPGLRPEVAQGAFFVTGTLASAPRAAEGNGARAGTQYA